ncbi:MAG: hypothetical protein HRF45_12710 [Fimbriimonadia bacterium]|jgi:hypothetical protein
MKDASSAVWQQRLQNASLAMGIWFGAGILAAVPLLALGVLTRTWSRMDILSVLTVGVAALVLLGPVCHLLRRAAVWAVALSALLLGAFYWLLMYTVMGHIELSEVNGVTRVYSALCPFLLGAATGWLILLGYRWHGWLPSSDKR